MAARVNSRGSITISRTAGIGAELPVRLGLADGPCWPDTRRSLYASALAQLGGDLPFQIYPAREMLVL